MEDLTPEEWQAVKDAAAEIGIDPQKLTKEQKHELLRDYKGEQALAEEEYAAGMDLMDTETPQGVQAGDIYVASNPLAHIGKGIKGYKGGKQMEKQKALMRELSKGREARDEVKRGVGVHEAALKLAAMNQRGLRQKPVAQPEAKPMAPQASPQNMMMKSAATPQPQPTQMPTGGAIPSTPEGWANYAYESPVGKVTPEMKAKKQQEMIAQKLKEEEEEERMLGIASAGRYL